VPSPKRIENGGTLMKRLEMILFASALFLLLNTHIGFAQFLEAGVEKFRAPVEAPDFTLKELSGEKVSLKELRGKIILLNFFATW